METTLENQSPAYSASVVRWQLALSFLAFILIGANDGALGVLLPSLRSHYGIDKAQAGLLFLAGTSGYLLAAFSSGLLVEKLGHRLFLMLGAACYTLAAFSLSMIPPFMAVLLTLLLLGFGIAILDAGLNSYIAGLPNKISLLNYLHAFYGLGALLGPLVASNLLNLNFGWNSVYFIWLSLSLTLLLGFAGLFQASGRLSEHVSPAQPPGNALTGAFRLRIVWLLAFFLLFYVGAEVSLGSWSYSLLTEERGQAALLSGWIVSGFWMGLTLGRLVLARVAERMGSQRFIQLCIAGVVAGIVMVWVAPGAAGSAIGLWLTGFSLGPVFPTTIAMMSGLVPARVLPSAIGFLASLGSMGAALFPFLAGNLAEATGLGTLLPYTILLTAIMLAFWVAARRNVKAAAKNLSQ